MDVMRVPGIIFFICGVHGIVEKKGEKIFLHCGLPNAAVVLFC